MLILGLRAGSYPRSLDLLGSVTPWPALKLGLQFTLILATIHILALLAVLLTSLLYVEVGRLIDGPVLRLARGRRGSNAKRAYFLSEKALDALTALHKRNLNTSEWSLNFSNRLGGWGSFEMLTLSALILCSIHWAAITGATTDISRGAIGQYVGTHLDLLISSAAFLLSLAPYVVLLAVLLSPRGRRVRFRSNAQIVTEATQQLAQLELRITDVVDASYVARSHLTDSRDSRAMWTVDLATNGRIEWYDEGLPRYLGVGNRAPDHPHFAEIVQPQDERVQRELDRHVKIVRRRLGIIEELGLSQICEVATSPISTRLRDLRIEFRRRLKRSTGSAPSGNVNQKRTHQSNSSGTHCGNAGFSAISGGLSRVLRSSGSVRLFPTALHDRGSLRNSAGATPVNSR